MPAGTVNFTSGSTVLGSASLGAGTSTNAATAAISTSALPTGYDTVTATYVPTGSFGASSGSYLQQVLSGYPTITTLLSSANPADAAQPVTFTAHVVAQNGANGTPAGSVTFSDGTSPRGSASLDNAGNAAFTISTLTRGTHTITAAFTATNAFAGSSNTLTQVINGLPTTAVLTTSPGPTVYGTGITLTVRVTPPVANPVISGIVYYFVDGVQAALSGPLGLISGDPDAVMFLNVQLPAGTHTLTCSYAGDTVFSPSTCAPVPFTVNAAPSSLTLGSFQNPSPALAPVALTAALTSGGAPLANMPVVFSIDGKAMTVSTAANGIATGSATLTAGSHAVTAAYAGTAAYTASSASLTQVAVANPTTIALAAAPNPAPQTQVVTVGATVHASTGTASPYGSITLYQGATPLGSKAVAFTGSSGPTTVAVSFPVSGLAPGTYDLTAAFTPADANFLASITAAPLPLVITPSDLKLTTDGSMSVQAEHYNHLAVTLQSIGGLSGSFTLACGALPAYATCTFAQPTLALTANNGTGTTLEIDTDAVHHFKSALSPFGAPSSGTVPAQHSRLPLLALLPLGWLPLAARRRKALRLVSMALLLVAGLGLTGCGDKYPDHTPPGTYTVQVTATSVNGTTPVPLTRTTTFQLTVTP